MPSLLALRAAANAMHRTAQGRLRPGHPFRGRLPKRPFPIAIAAEYSTAINRMIVGTLRSALAPLEHELPGMIHRAEAEKAAARADAGDGDRISRLIEAARGRLGGEVDPHRVRGLALRISEATSRQQLGALRHQMRAIVGVDLHWKDRSVPLLIEQFATENAQLVRSLGNRTLDKIASRVARGFAAGHTMADITGDIADEYGIAQRHARFIADDQIRKLSTQVTSARMQEIGVRKAVWLTMNDDRVRDSHADMEGVEFDLADPPVIDGERSLPGEPPGCRCGFDPVV